MAEDFFVRYYIGHKGRHGHEFLEFEISSDGKMRYANNSLYKQDGMIRKEAYLNDNCLTELRRIIETSQIMREDDNLWPEPDENGRQELEVVMGDQHISFCTAKIGTMAEVEACKDNEGLRCFYYLVQDIKCFVLAAIAVHFRINPL